MAVFDRLRTENDRLDRLDHARRADGGDDKPENRGEHEHDDRCYPRPLLGVPCLGRHGFQSGEHAGARRLQPFAELRAQAVDGHEALARLRQ